MVPAEDAWHIWTPNKGKQTFAGGTARYLPARCTISMYLHYGPTGVPQRDSSSLRLWFADELPSLQARTVPLLNKYNVTGPAFAIPAGETTRVHASYTLKDSLTITSVTPQSHLPREELGSICYTPGWPFPGKTVAYSRLGRHVET